jgi:aryl-alcohol dehydrogenase
MKVTAAVARAAREPFDVTSLELDEPREDEILVRIEAVGICHTDLAARDQILRTPLPAVLGHEGVGVVERVGSAVRKVAPGDRVILTFRSCGRCRRCEAHEPAYCQTGPALNYAARRKDGSKAFHEGETPIGSNFFGQSSFSTHALVYESNAIKVTTRLPATVLAPLGCGVQAGAGGVLRALNCEPGSSLVVTGGGAVGLSAVLAAVVAGCGSIVVVEPRASRRDLARELGATHSLAPDDASTLAKRIRELVSTGMDYALDTTGIPAVMDAALHSLRPHGTLGLLGIPREAKAPVPGSVAEVLTLGWRIKGIIGGDSDPDEFIPYLIDLHERGLFPFDRLIRTYPFAAINDAVRDQSGGETIKPVLAFTPAGDR